MSCPLKVTKISASGRITSVMPTFAFIMSKKYGSVFINTGTELEIDGNIYEGTENDLTTLLQVDDVVHFKAIKNFGPKDCPWLATWLRRSKRQENADMPAELTDEQGVVTFVQDCSMFIWNSTYGEVYYPIGVHLTNIRQSVDDAEQAPLKSMRDYFKANQTVIFSATRQTELNNCMYLATSARSLDEVSSNAEGEDGRGDIGRIVKVTPHYGFIVSDSLGMIFFSLSNCMVESSGLMLTDVFVIGDMVKFSPMRQAEVNGCCWRALNVAKLEVPASDEMFMRHIFDQPATNSLAAEQAMVPCTSVMTEDKACQTHPSAESLLLRAMLSNPSFYDEMRYKFPHLMRMIDKSF